ncbi:Uncharacterised protein [Yersinia kristensenii]|nr:Uncharacterised protein [Yersinia kristensenii]
MGWPFSLVKNDTNEEESARLVTCFLYKMEHQAGTFEIKQNRSRTILNRYITLGSSNKTQIDGTRQRAFQIIHENLTGLTFTPVDTEQQERDKLAAIIASKRGANDEVSNSIVVEVSANDDSIVGNDEVSVKPTNKARAFMKLF